MATDEQEKTGLSRYVTPLTAWALAFGSSIGWGAFVMPGTTFLPIAGPLGSVLGLAVGTLIMLIIGVSYHYLMGRYPDSGGAFTYAKKVLGYDHGFLCAWFLSLTYIAIIWANATALPLIARNLLGNAFQFGFSYEIAGFHIYFGEIVLSSVALILAGLVCLRSKVAGWVQVVMAVALIVGVGICFVGVTQQHPAVLTSDETIPMSNSAMMFGFFNIIALAPWAFVGFESISHSTGEFTFSPKKTLPIMFVAVIAAAIGYGLLVLLATAVQPAGYANWFEYINDLGNLNGVEGLPVFYAIRSVMGDFGGSVVGVAALGGIVTGLIGNCVAASRLLYSMALDDMLPARFAKLNKGGAPANVILFIIGISIIIMFVGRAAVSWIVDVTTVGATIAYAYTSVCAFKVAQKRNDTVYAVFGGIGFLIAIVLMLSFLVPNLLAISTLSMESYLILAIWSVLGFAFFRHIFKKDTERRLGHSVIVWIVLLALILFTSLVWVRQSSDAATDQAAAEIQQTYAQVIETHHGAVGDLEAEHASGAFIAEELSHTSTSIWVSNIIQMVLIVAALLFMFDIYRIMQKRERQIEIEKVLAEESSRAKTSFLSNMSHEIRTPMNAIIGLDNIALQDPDLPPRTREQLEKIGGSARHLLGLINDILDMSRIESGRMSLKSEEFLFRDFLDQINVIINGQCEDKGLTYECRVVGQVGDYYVGDDMKLKQVLINILGNSVKFTDSPGTVTFSVEQVSQFEGLCTLRFTMADTGIGMDADYLPKIFEAFSQEDATATNVYGGSGLGMAITKSIVEMMNGQIDVESEKGVGTTFTVTVTLNVSNRTVREGSSGALPKDLQVLVVDDDKVAGEHARLVLSAIGVSSETCTSGAEALRHMEQKRKAGNPYGLLVTDYRMPDMDGIELTREIRRIGDESTAIIILTGYSFDDVTDEAWEAGADALMTKPLFTDTLLREIKTALRKRTDFDQVDEQVEEGQEEEESAYVTVLAGKRVLLAEDIEINADIMIDLLDMEDVEAEHAENGKIAVDMFDESEQGYYDAVLMDVRMPVMDGLTATSEIRKLDRTDAKTVPIIAMTANAFDEDVQRSLQAGMNAHLSKPVEPERLYSTLGKLISERAEG